MLNSSSTNINESNDVKYLNVVFVAKNPRENESIQSELFSLGYRWSMSFRQTVRSFEDDNYPIYIFAEMMSGIKELNYMGRRNLENYNGIEEYLQ